MITYVIQYYYNPRCESPIVVQDQTPTGAISQHEYGDESLGVHWQVIEVKPDASGDVTIYEGTMDEIRRQHLNKENEE